MRQVDDYVKQFAIDARNMLEDSLKKIDQVIQTIRNVFRRGARRCDCSAKHNMAKSLYKVK